MSNSNSPNFSPDGMRGGSMERRHETGHSARETRGGHRADQAEAEHGHDYYDDGLVHSHGWAASTNER
jgi:hypothetical protein